MNDADIAQMRLNRQLLTAGIQKKPKNIVTWMGAMQAQDFPMARWAIGVRSPGSKDTDIVSAINNAEIIRTHLLRPTWHFVAADDISWMIDLTALQIRNSQKARDKELELTEEIYSQSNSIIEKSFSQADQLSRDELITELNKAGIKTDQNRASHLLMRAELEKIVCSGGFANGKLHYASFSARIRKLKKLAKEEALRELAKRYFASRGPATLKDFQWWSGLPAGDARHALEYIKTEFHEEVVSGKTYWLNDDKSRLASDFSSAHLLPTYDEYLISYIDRNAAIAPELAQSMNEISNRGVFRPIMVVNGRVIGTWKRTIKRDSVIIELQPFSREKRTNIELITKSAEAYATFIEKNPEILLQRP